MDITYGPELIIDLQECDISTFTEAGIRKYIKDLCAQIGMKRHGDTVFWHDYSDTPHLKGISAMQFIETSSIVIHTLDFLHTALINIFSCKDFDKENAIRFSKNFFGAKRLSYQVVERKTRAFDNPKVEVRHHEKFGKGVFAMEKIFAGETIAVFDGKIYTESDASQLPNAPPLKIRDHVIQFAKNKYRISAGIASSVNHSCNPNCGIKDKFKIVAMRDIKKGEEISWDYDMSENSDWSMQCKCGNKNCRAVIKGFRYLPKKRKEMYKGYISNWLIKDHKP
jgi:S-adenosylmethionine/arginine decarboxylase-like enzyme